MPYVVGLTGGIGSGKSEVTRAFAAKGVDIADADVAAHAVTQRDAIGFNAVCDAFGHEAIQDDGELDRAWLRRVVFADPAARARLEGLLHPLIHARLETQIVAWTSPYGLLSVPLLLEKKTWIGRLARVLVVDCTEDEQVRRVMRRSALTAEQVRAIMATQMSREQRLAGADDVIDNSGDLAALGPQVERLDLFYRSEAKAREALEQGRGSTDNGPQKKSADRT